MYIPYDLCYCTQPMLNIINIFIDVNINFTGVPANYHTALPGINFTVKLINSRYLISRVYTNY